MTLFLILLHLTAAIVILAASRKSLLHLQPSMIPLAVLLPLWGPVMVLARELHVRGGEKADEEPGEGPFGITDEVYRSINMEEKGVADILPMEDVLASGTPARRRSMLLSVLHSGPAPFVRSLRIAGVNEDTEVVHYAVTALVELRSEFAQRIDAMETRLRRSPQDLKVLMEYAALDEEYLRSGIPENSERTDRILHCRTMLEKSLQVLSWQERESGSQGSLAPQGLSGSVRPDGGTRDRSPYSAQRISLLGRIGEICLLQGDTAAAEKAGAALVEERPDEEGGYLLILRARAQARDGQGVEQIIAAVRQRNIYLSPAAREQLAFWTA